MEILVVGKMRTNKSVYKNRTIFYIIPFLIEKILYIYIYTYYIHVCKLYNLQIFDVCLS